MTTYKNTSGDFTLTCQNGNGIFTINAQTNFLGNVTYNVPATTSTPFITVAANNTGTIQDMGLIAQINPSSFAGLRFDVAANTWQISSSVRANGAPIAAYTDIGGSTGNAAGGNTQIQFNQAGAFGASGNLTYDYANNALTLQGYEVLGNIGATPGTTPTNAVAIYNSTVGGGGTGVYVLSTEVNDELISKTQAIVYSLIF